jgi:hypothetical protein
MPPLIPSSGNPVKCVSAVKATPGCVFLMAGKLLRRMYRGWTSWHRMIRIRNSRGLQVQSQKVDVDSVAQPLLLALDYVRKSEHESYRFRHCNFVARQGAMRGRIAAAGNRSNRSKTGVSDDGARCAAAQCHAGQLKSIMAKTNDVFDHKSLSSGFDRDRFDCNGLNTIYTNDRLFFYIHAIGNCRLGCVSDSDFSIE